MRPNSMTGCLAVRRISILLIGQERAKIIVLSRTFIGCRKIEDDICSVHGQTGTGWNRCPKVFAKLDAEVSRRSTEHQIVSQWNELLMKDCFFYIAAAGRNKPALFLKLPVIGQITLGHHTKNSPPTQTSALQEEKARMIHPTYSTIRPKSPT